MRTWLVILFMAALGAGSPVASAQNADHSANRPEAAAGGVLAQAPADGHTDPVPANFAAIRTKLQTSVKSAAQSAAQAALKAAKEGPSRSHAGSRALPTQGQPGDVRLVCVRTNVIERSRWIVPKVPVPPFIQWNKWLDAHPFVSHCALDWMDDAGQWWRTELRSFYQIDGQYRVGEGEFRATGTTTYGIFITPGRSDPEDQEVLLDEKINADYRKIIEVAREYARKDKRAGEPGTGGNGERNVGLGGPAWRPSCNSNTYISYLLRRQGVQRAAPEGAIGWERVPTFPYSSDADVYRK